MAPSKRTKLLRIACCLLISCLFSTSVFATQKAGTQIRKPRRQPGPKPGEYVVVTAPTGYLLDNRGNVLQQLPVWTHLLVAGSEQGLHRVETPAGRKGWINSALVQPNPLKSASQEDLIAAEKAVLLLARSMQQLNADQRAAALGSALGALKEVESTIGRYNELCPWILATVGYLQLANGNAAAAEATLTKADGILRNLKTRGIARADVLNARAILLGSQNEYDAAIAAYKRAIVLSSGFNGDSHSDVRVITGNLAATYSMAGNQIEAARQQLVAHKIGKRILPDGAKEQVESAYLLGSYLALANRGAEAVPYLREALDGTERLNGANSDRATEIRGILAKLPAGVMDKVDSEASRTAAVTDPNTFVFLPESEWMLRTRKITEIKDGDRVIKRVPAGTRLWSLRQQDGWHSVRVPGGDGFGWVADSAVESLADQVAMQRLMQAMSRIGNESERLQAMQHASQAIELMTAAERAANANNGPEAVNLLERAMTSADAALGGESFLSATIRSQLASYHAANEEYVKARLVLEESLPLQRRVLGKNNPHVASSLFTLADLLNQIGDVDGSVRHSTEALQIAENAFGPRDPRTAYLQAVLGYRLVELGQFEQAKSLFLKAEATDQKNNRPTLTSTGAELGRAQIELLKGNTPAAQRLAFSSLKRLQDLGLENSFQHANTLALQALTELKLGQPKKARELSRRAAAIVKEMDFVDRRFVSQNTGLQGYAAFLDSDIKKARKLGTEAVDLMSAALGENHRSTAELRHELAMSLVADGSKDAGVAQFEQARRDIHSYAVRALADLTPQQQIRFLQSADADNFHLALSLGIAEEQFAETSATWLLNGKNLAHEIAARTARASRLVTSGRDKQTLADWFDVRRRLATLPDSTDSKPAALARQQERERLSQLERRLFARLPASVSKGIERQRTPWVTCDEVRARLKADETLVEILRLTPTRFESAVELNAIRRHAESAEGRKAFQHYVAWIIPPKGAGDVIIVDLGLADPIDDLVRDIRKRTLDSYLQINDLGEAEALKELEADYARLGRIAWNPIESRLGGREGLCLSPDGNLWLVPWGALPAKDGRLVIEHHRLRFSVSGRYLKPEDRAASQAGVPVVMADPDFDSSNADVLTEATKLLGPVIESLRKLLPAVPQIELPFRAEELPGTATEAVEITPHVAKFSGKDPRVLVRSRASELVFKTIKRPDVLMVGTHGFFMPRIDVASDSARAAGTRSASALALKSEDANPLLRCGLLLAGCNSSSARSGFDDGVLTGEEIVSTDLRGTRLVVLSACETGVGEVQNGQGVAGLRQSFELAGADSVVSTLWQIDDVETSRLMTEFFKNLAAGLTKSEALRQAQITRIHARRERHGGAHPAFWAAFTLTGSD